MESDEQDLLEVASVSTSIDKMVLGNRHCSVNSLYEYSRFYHCIWTTKTTILIITVARRLALELFSFISGMFQVVFQTRVFVLFVLYEFAAKISRQYIML